MNTVAVSHASELDRSHRALVDQCAKHLDFIKESGMYEQYGEWLGFPCKMDCIGDPIRDESGVFYVNCSDLYELPEKGAHLRRRHGVYRGVYRVVAVLTHGDVELEYVHA